MKILWVSNSPIGPAATILDEKYQGSSGGWIQSEYDRINKDEKQFYFLSTHPRVKKGDILKKSNDIGTLYCVHTPKLSYGIKPPIQLQKNVQMILDQIQPDIIQIWGTETWLSNAVSECEVYAPKIVFIQGLLGIHQKYLGGYLGLLQEDHRYLRTFDIFGKIKGLLRKRYFIKQAAIERITLRKCANVVVDSDFARAYCFSVSPDISCYHHVLSPDQIYNQYKWKYENCNQHTIFTIYGGSAEKGIQNLFKSVAIVKKSYPDVKIVIPGPYQIDLCGKLKKDSKDYFQKIMYRMIKQLDIQDNVIFTGKLDKNGMAENMLKCHVFVNPSCMEVHALSLREAMTVGTPCISSLCGSAGEWIHNGNNGFLYRYEEYETLAYYLKCIFSAGKDIQQLLNRATNNLRQENSLSLDEIYKQIL